MEVIEGNRDNVVSLANVQTEKLYDAMDCIGEDSLEYHLDQAVRYDVSYWTVLFSVLTHAIWEMEYIVEQGEEGAKTARNMLNDFTRYFGEAAARASED